MVRHLCVSFCGWLPPVFVSFFFAAAAHAVPTIWTGPDTTFSKVGSDDPTLAANQDRLTNNVWLTRGSIEGMFNIAPGHETNYIRFTSPADTQWATDVMAANDGKTITATNWQNLTFTNWAPSYGGPGFALGGNITTHNAVVHLVTDDIYLNLLFTQFTSGGDFTYQRSTAAAPSPTGDYNGNHLVDAADYAIWRKTLNQTGVPLGSGADGNANGTIDSGDYTFWRQRFGNTAAASAAGGYAVANAVPEPAAMTLLLMGVLVLLLNVRQTPAKSSRDVIEKSAPCWTRTNNLLIKSQLLCQLS